MLANLRDAEDIPSMQPPVTPPSRPSVPRLGEHEVGRPEDGNLPVTSSLITFFPGLRAWITHGGFSAEAMTFLPSTGKSFILGRVDEAVSNELGLGELAGLTVANEAESLVYDVSSLANPHPLCVLLKTDRGLSLLQVANNQDALRKTWNPKFTLRSHFDSVRSLAFHPVEPVLVTASEDHTLKLWNLQKTAPAKK